MTVPREFRRGMNVQRKIPVLSNTKANHIFFLIHTEDVVVLCCAMITYSN